MNRIINGRVRGTAQLEQFGDRVCGEPRLRRFAHVQRRDDVNEGQRMMKKLPHRRKKEKLREDSWM